MNIIDVKPAALYQLGAGHFAVTTGDREHHYAYLVLGRAGDQVMIVEGEGVEKAAAIEHLARKTKLLKDWFDVALHGAFWSFYEEQQDKRKDETKAMLRAMGLAGPETPVARKKVGDDEGGLS